MVLTIRSKFTIDPLTGVLSFIVAPNFKAPNDIGGDNGDNVYEFEIQVTDGQRTRRSGYHRRSHQRDSDGEQ